MTTRRDTLRALLGLPLAAALPSACSSPEPPLEASGELLGPSMALGHRLRDGIPLELFRDAPTVRSQVLVVGGGPSGLSAAYRFLARGVEDLRLLELEPSPGGTSRAGESAVSRYPWGAHYLPLPTSANPALVRLLDEMGALEGVDEAGEPVGAEHVLVREPESRVFYQGFWYSGLYLHAGSSRQDREELDRFRRKLDAFAALRDGSGRSAFALPTRLGSDDPDLYALDRLTAAEWLEREGFRSERLRWLVDYACRDDYGLAAESTSAWAALFYWAARMRGPGHDTQPLLTWPEGNGALVAHLVRRLGRRVETDRAAVRITPKDDSVEVLVLADGGTRPIRYVARRCVVALPRFLASRVVRREGGAPAIDDEGFVYGPWMVANLHLADRPPGRGFEASWDNVLYDGPSLGYVCATHQRAVDRGPTVWTYYRPFAGSDAHAERRVLAGATHGELSEAVLADLERPHPGLRALVRRLDVFRWGHAMVQPRPGFVSSLSRRRAAEPLGRLHFAHSDLSGVPLFEEAFDQGIRSADEAIAAEPGAFAARDA